MEYEKIAGTFPSADGSCDVAYYIYRPKEQNPKAVIQVCHGMCEYIERYEREGFMSDMTARGYVVCGCDHLGHGRTAPSEEELGYFAEYEPLADNQKLLYDIVRKTYRRLPYILFGHSMGSFVARDFMVRYGTSIDGVVLCGTSGTSKQPLGFGIFLTSLIERLRGDHYRSKLVANLADTGRNKSWKNERDSLSWLTDVKECRDRYRNDPLCTFKFTVRAYNRLMRLMQYISSDAWYEGVPKSLPVLIISGMLDPIGADGEGVREVYDKLNEMELSDLRIKLYEGARHELLNSSIRDKVIEDLDEWATDIIEGVREKNTLGAEFFARFIRRD
ncbi:MAG TPA: alpha/beta fold hydrolase [Bacillota bacterium]|nr:alpha/beta hydrolase [Clostridiales bacterium]HPT85529.1 alpha/beta fold hydrolase [Bacillota bacterium]